MAITSRRRLLTGSAAIASLAALQERADAANVPFTTFGFKSTGGNTPLTMPDRLAQVKNVLDFGADNTGGNDCSTAIQNAINATSGANRGTIFFPTGSYKVTSTITYNYNGALSIEFVGEGISSSIFSSGVTGYIFDRVNVNSGSPLYTAGGLIGFRNLSIQNGTTTSGGAIRMGSTVGGFVRDCILSGFVCYTSEDSPGSSSQNLLLDNVQVTSTGTTGCKGFVIGGTGNMINCSGTTCEVAMTLYGNGFFSGSNRWERNDTGVLIGVDSTGNDRGASGFVVFGGSNEGPLTGFNFSGTCSGFYLSTGVLGYQGNAGTTGGSNTLTGVLVGSKSSAGVLGIETFQWFDTAGIQINTASSRANLLFVSCEPTQGAGAGVPWILPSNAYTAQFQNCNINPTWNFSQLPTIGGGNDQEGDEYNIKDSSTATWGANVSGSGSNHALVRNNGTHYTVVGI